MSREPAHAQTTARKPRLSIQWREWSKDSFEEARDSNRLVLLDLSAEWCHWCHVMDDTTYSDAEVIRTVNERFVPVRVDIDKRPDISERYARGGFPTTAFLSDQGEPIWGATYVPPEDMKRILKTVLAGQQSGEIAEALERARMQCLDISKTFEKDELVDSEFVDAVFEDIFASYDVQWGGFGTAPKFPHAEAVDLLIERYAQTNDAEIRNAISTTLDHMTDGLFDTVEGGVFRYSVKRDWKLPHYEKMLDTNLGFLRNLARAYKILGQDRYRTTAHGVGSYILGTLRDRKTGAFFSSQDADEEYYKLERDFRLGRLAPRVIEDVYSGLNCRSVSVLIEAGTVLGVEDWVQAATKAWKIATRDHLNPEKGIVRHMAGVELFLFEDQVDFLEALLAVAETQAGDEQERTIKLGEGLVRGVEGAFSHPEGGYGDVRKEDGAIGRLAQPERSIVGNSRWARNLALFGAASHNTARNQEALSILESFNPRGVQASGLFASEYVRAWDVLRLGVRRVEIHNVEGDLSKNALWMAAKRTLNPAAVVMAASGKHAKHERSRTFAVICGDRSCSKEILEPDELVSQLTTTSPGQI